MNTYGYVGGNPINYFDPDGLRKTVGLSDGYIGEVDTFPVNGRASFEIHVKNPKGNEVGIFGPQGWFNKHGHKGRPEGIPDSVDQRCKGVAVDFGRRARIIPKRGNANIKGNNWMKYFKMAGKAGPLTAFSGMSGIDIACSKNPWWEEC